MTAFLLVLIELDVMYWITRLINFYIIIYGSPAVDMHGVRCCSTSTAMLMHEILNPTSPLQIPHIVIPPVHLVWHFLSCNRVASP